MTASQDELYAKNSVSTDIVFLEKEKTLSRHSCLTEVSKRGLTVQSKRSFLLMPEKDFSEFLGQPVRLFLSQYELLFYGVVKKISQIGKDLFKIQIGFMEGTPLYYRECVEDLLN